MRSDQCSIVGFRALGPSTCGQGVVLVSKVSVSWLVSHVKQKVGLYVKRARLVSVVYLVCSVSVDLLGMA
jgi:hypothetical protein